MSADVKQSDRKKVLVALEGATRLTRTDIHGRKVFNFHRTKDQINALGEALESDGHIIRLWIEQEPGQARDKRIEVWEVNMQGASESNGSSLEPLPSVPPGEGWLPKTPTLRRAQRGVVPAVAARAGRIVRKAEAERKGVIKPGRPRVTDEQRGASHLIRHVVKSYKDQGVIEIQGDWIRLAKNPPRRPPRHWYESLLYFLAEGHPTLDGKWQRKPKALVPFTESLLGRRLRPDENVTRRPGRTGSWNPADIIVASDDGVRYLFEMLDDDR